MAAAVLPYLLLAWVLWFQCDDAFISYRYARHLAEGHGLRFNLGPQVPVEGMSDLLWVGLAAVGEAVGVPAPELMPSLSFGAGLLGLGLVYRLARGAGASVTAASAAVVLLGAHPVYAAWATGGLETMALAVLLLALVGAASRGSPAVVPLAVALTLLRVEGAMWAWAALALADGDPRRRRAGALAVAATLLALCAFRLAWFGALVPNVVRVKVGPSPWLVVRGLAYVALAAGTFPPLAAGVVWAARRAGRDRAAALAIVVVAWAVLVGGDYLPWFRFLVPALPLLAVTIAPALDTLDPRRATAVVVGALLLHLAPLLPLHVVPEPLLGAAQGIVGTRSGRFVPEVVAWRRERDKVPFRRAKARALLAHTDPGDVVVARGVGALGYETELFVLDAYGLVSPEVVAQTELDVLRAPGHDRRLNRGSFLGYVPDLLFNIGLSGRRRDEVLDLLPHQWGLFEDLGDGLLYVAELHAVPAGSGPFAPSHLLLVRRVPEGSDLAALRESFKAACREAGFVAPRLPPLDDRRREVALEKRRGGDQLMEVLWGPGGVPRR